MGMVLQGIVSIFIVTFELDPLYFIAANIVSGIFGGVPAILAGAFSYIADLSTPKWRSLRIGIAEGALALGASSGQLLGGYWLRKVNCDYMPQLYFFTAVSFAMLLYVLFVLPESLSNRKREELQDKGPRGFQAYIEGFKLYCGKLPIRSTWNTYVTTLAISTVGFNLFGAILIDVYFLKALPFDFSAFQIGLFEAIRSASQGLSNIFVVAFFIGLKVHDSWIMLVAVLFHISGCMLLAFSAKTWQIYTGWYQQLHAFIILP